MWLNLREFFTFCSILGTIHLKKRCSGRIVIWHIFLEMEPKWKTFWNKANFNVYWTDGHHFLPPTFFGLCCLAKDFCTSNLRKWYCQLTSETYCKLQKILCASLPLCLLEVEHRLGKVWGLSVTSLSAKFFFFTKIELDWKRCVGRKAALASSSFIYDVRLPRA